MDAQILRELEIAAQIILAPPNIVNNEQRKAAEEVFINFKKTKSPYSLCKYILESCKVDYVLFEVASFLKEVVIREWTLVPESDISSLRQYLLQYVAEKSNVLPIFVREKISQVIAVMVKRGSVMDNGAYRKQLINEIENLIMNADHSKKMLGCSLLVALMQEYSITEKSTDIGLTWKANMMAKAEFESSDLKRIFQFCCKLLSYIENPEETLPEETLSLLKQLLAISEFILSWNFTERYISKVPPFTESILDVFPQQALRLKPNWKDSIIEARVVNLFFLVYWKIRSNPQLSHHALTCLVQLATIKGTIFDNKDHRIQYLGHYIEGFVNFLANVKILDREALGLSNIVRKLLPTFTFHLIKALPAQLLQSFIEQLVLLTCNFIEGAAMEEQLCEDDGLYVEAFDNVMIAWMNVLRDIPSFWKENHQNALIQIFNAYLKCHLSAPLGTRQPSKSSEEEEDELEEPDREKYRDQLITIGEIARLCPEHCLPLLSHLIEDKTKEFSSRFKTFLSSGYENVSEVGSLISLYDDFHWLLLIACNVISEDPSCESMYLPSALKQYSIKQSSTTSVEVTLQVFGSPNKNFDEIPQAEEKADHVVRLISSVLRLSCLCQSILEVKKSEFLSPEVVSSMLWFLNQWATVYILEKTSGEEQESAHFSCSFGMNSAGAVWAINYLLEQSVNYLVHMESEPAVVRDAISLFISLVGNKTKVEYILKNDNLMKILTVQGSIPQKVKRDVFKGLTLAGTALKEENSRREYLDQVLKPVQTKLLTLVSQENFSRIAHEEGIKIEVINILDCMIGASLGAKAHVRKLVFDSLCPMISQLPILMRVYHNYQQIVELLLMTLYECVNNLLPDQAEENAKVYEACLNTIQMYALRMSGKLTLESDSQDDAFTDIVLLIDLLKELLFKDTIDLAERDENQQSLAAIDTCLYGLNLIMPLVTVELLKYPTLCYKYFTLIQIISELHADKILKLPENLMKTLFSTVELGLSSFGEEIVSFCCHFIRNLAFYIYTKSNEGEAPPECTKPFLKLLMNMALAYYPNSDCMPATSGAIYTLICCYQEEYNAYVESVLSAQADPVLRERLGKAFNNLTNNISFRADKRTEQRFYYNFENFVINVCGIFQ